MFVNTKLMTRQTYSLNDVEGDLTVGCCGAFVWSCLFLFGVLLCCLVLSSGRRCCFDFGPTLVPPRKGAYPLLFSSPLPTPFPPTDNETTHTRWATAARSSSRRRTASTTPPPPCSCPAGSACPCSSPLRSWWPRPRSPASAYTNTLSTFDVVDGGCILYASISAGWSGRVGNQKIKSNRYLKQPLFPPSPLSPTAPSSPASSSAAPSRCPPTARASSSTPRAAAP